MFPINNEFLHPYPEKRFGLRELARALKVSLLRTSEVLEFFSKYGVVNRIRIGNISEKSSVCLNE